MCASDAWRRLRALDLTDLTAIASSSRQLSSRHTEFRCGDSHNQQLSHGHTRAYQVELYRTRCLNMRGRSLSCFDITAASNKLDVVDEFKSCPNKKSITTTFREGASCWRLKLSTITSFRGIGLAASQLETSWGINPKLLTLDTIWHLVSSQKAGSPDNLINGSLRPRTRKHDIVMLISVAMLKGLDINAERTMLVRHFLRLQCIHGGTYNLRLIE